MPTKVTATEGDCLCGIASNFGLADCQPLRDAPENAAFKDKPLKAGDEVTIPDLVVEEFNKAVDSKHVFKLKTSPPVNIRFVHGSPNLPYRDDHTVPVLHVSNFVTNLGGATGLRPFPKGYGYHDDGHADLDSFKVEVWDPKGGSSVEVKLEALKPKYKAGPAGKLVVDSYEEFADAKRKIDKLVCNVVSSSTPNTFRSKYMRLVVDEEDRDNAGVTDQVLFVSDMADGNGTGAPGDNDSLEILDQMVRATYEVKRCPGTPKCKVMTVAPIGGDERQRVRLDFYVYRKTVGGAVTPHGVSIDDVKKHLRRRTFKWYRRVFASADMSPLLRSITVKDPPAENMICLSHATGNAAKNGSTISFRITTATKDDPVSVTMTADETPSQVAARIIAGLPAGYKGESFECTKPFTAANRPHDVLITSDNGERVTLLDIAITAGAGMTVAVPRVDLMNVKAADAEGDGSLSFATIDFKRILRDIPVTDDAMHCIVIGEFNTKGLRGQAFIPGLVADADLQTALPFRSSTIMAYKSDSGPVLDGGDNLPFTSPHESAHTLADLSHTKPSTPHDRTQLLGSGTSEANAVGATKRLGAGPYTVTFFQFFKRDWRTVQKELATEIRALSGPKMEAW